MYKDNWIFKSISPLNLPVETTVAELIDEEHMWDVAKLNQHFMHKNIEVILQIPFPRNQHEDEILWHYDKRG